jgi:hypothetical protein
VHARLRERNPGIFSLGAVDQVTEDPSNAAGGLAMARHRPLAVAAAPTGGNRRHEHPVTFSEAAHRRPCRHYRAHGLVAKDPAIHHSRYIPLENVQVSAADRSRINPDDNVGGLGRAWVRDRVPGLSAGPVVHQRLQASLPNRDCQRPGCFDPTLARPESMS